MNMSCYKGQLSFGSISKSGLSLLYCDSGQGESAFPVGTFSLSRMGVPGKYTLWDGGVALKYTPSSGPHCQPASS